MNFIQDIRFALRMLMKNRGFTIIAVLTLALGIGANTAVFSLVDTLLIKPMPFPDPDRLVFIWNTNPNIAFDKITVTSADYRDFAAQSTSFEAMGLYRYDTANLAGSGQPRQVSLIRAEPSFLSLHQLPAEAGRLFSSSDDPEADDVIMLSHAFWQSQFGGDPDLVGRKLTLDNQTRTVIGVLPKAFAFNWNDVDAWVPLKLGPEDVNRDRHDSRVAARLLPGVSMETAQAELAAIATRLGEAYPETNAAWGVSIESYRENIINLKSRRAFLFMAFAVAFVLLIACTNVANLLIAKSSARRREIAVRVALGAGQWRLIRQLISESLVLAIIGGVLGLMLAAWGLDVLVASLPEQVPLQDEIRLNRRSLIFTGFASLASAFLFGLMPAIGSARQSLVESLKDGGTVNSASKSRKRGRDVLVIGQIAMAMALVLCTGLMIKSFLNIMRFDPGFNMRQLMTVQVNLPTYAYEDEPQQGHFTAQMLERVRSLPGVLDATTAFDVPVGSFPQATLFVEGYENPDENAELWTHFNYIGTEYFKTLRIPLIEGRTFTDQDDRDGAGVVVVNTFLAQRFWPDESALGQRVRLSDEEGEPWLTVVGVVENTVLDMMDRTPGLEVYRPAAQEPRARVNIIARAETDPHTLVTSMQSAIWALDPNLPIAYIRTMRELFDDNLGAYGTFVGLMFTLAGIALVLSSVGLYGVIAYTVEMRRQEMGIRLSLGATTRDVLGLVLRRGIGITFIGVVLGAILATMLARLLESVMLDVTPTDPVIFLGVGGLLILVALASSYIPARRVTKIDPLQALRCE